MNNKIVAISVVFLLSLLVSFLYFNNVGEDENAKQTALDARFEEVAAEVENYGGSMIVSYDVETGEITGKRRADEHREAGVMSITEDTYDEKKDGWPEGTLAISRDMSPTEAIEYGGNI